jgi:hypothetical protein
MAIYTGPQRDFLSLSHPSVLPPTQHNIDHHRCLLDNFSMSNTSRLLLLLFLALLLFAAACCPTMTVIQEPKQTAKQKDRCQSHT